MFIVTLFTALPLVPAYADDPLPAAGQSTQNSDSASLSATALTSELPSGTVQRQLFDRINAIRAEHGLPAFKYSLKLEIAAQTHVMDMQRNDLRSHRGSDGSMYYERLVAAGYKTADRWGTANETIGWGNNLDRQVTWWMNSTVHRNIILSSRYTEIGIGYSGDPNAKWGHWWTVNYAVPQ